MDNKNIYINLPALVGKKLVKRDVKGRKMTQKGAIHQKNSAKQPNRSMLSNHERHQLRSIRKSIENENVSYGELAFLQSKKEAVLQTGDEVLAEWAGISESEFRKWTS